MNLYKKKEAAMKAASFFIDLINSFQSAIAAIYALSSHSSAT